MSSVFSLKFVEARSWACHSSNHLITATDKRVSSWEIVPSLAYHYWQALSVTFLQPGALTFGSPVLISCHINLGKKGKNGPMTWDCTKKAFSDNTDVLGPSFSKKWGTRVMVYKGHRGMSILTAPNFPPINHTGGPKVAPFLCICIWHCNRILCKSRFLTLQ